MVAHEHLWKNQSHFQSATKQIIVKMKAEVLSEKNYKINQNYDIEGEHVGIDIYDNLHKTTNNSLLKTSRYIINPLHHKGHRSQM